jgi:hypothetical protein
MTLLITTAIPAVESIKNNNTHITLQCINRADARDEWNELQKLLASDGVMGSSFGLSVLIDGNYAIIGAMGDDSAYIFTRLGPIWIEQDKLLGSDDSVFGHSVSIDGDNVIIGAIFGDVAHGDWSGSAYIFTRSVITWTEQDKLLASDVTGHDFFGWSVSIDGDYAIIGAPGDDDNGEHSGSAYIFTRSGNTWTEQDKLLASDGEDGDSFGISVSIDGDYAIIGAHDDDNGEDSGSAYIFTRSGNTWTEQDKLLASDGIADDYFGCSVSIDGDTVIVGAIGDDDNGDYTGSAYIFKRSGNTWTEQDKLLASDGAKYDGFGRSVSIDGEYAIVGAPGDDDNGETSGSVYVFTRSGGNQPPTVEIIYPIEGQTVSSTITITGIADDPDRTVQRVEIKINEDGNWDTATGTNAWSYEWDTTTVLDGYNAIYARSYDGELYSQEAIVNANVDNEPNDPPMKPATPVGPVDLKVGEQGTYTTSTTDPDGDPIFYLFDWGDGTDTGWIEAGEASHIWSVKDIYEIKVKAKDSNDYESTWSNPLSITVPRNKIINNPIFTKFIEAFMDRFPLFARLLRL